MSNTTTTRALAQQLSELSTLMHAPPETRSEQSYNAPGNFMWFHAADIAALLVQLSDENAKLLDALVGMVAQHCAWRDSLLHDNALSADEDAIDVLMNMGAIRMVSEKPLAYDWIPQQEATL